MFCGTQIYQKLEEIRHFQRDSYNYHTVSELQTYLLGFHPIPEDELHSMSTSLEPRIRRYASALIRVSVGGEK